MADDTTPKGLTPRDYFAGQALAGLIAAYKDEIEKPWIPADLSGVAYMWADAMVKQSKED